MEKNKESYELIAPNKNETYKTIRLQESRDNLGAKELDIIDILLSQLKYGDINKKKLIIEMCVDDYKDLYINSENIYRDLKRSCKNLQGAGIFVEDKINNKEKWYSLFSTIEYLNSQAKIIVTFTEEIKEILFEEDIKRIWYGLKYSIRLTNRYSKKRYYHVKGFCYGRHMREEFADDLMKKLEVPKSYYDNFAKFEKHILKKSDNDINLMSDLYIETEVDKSKKPYKIKTRIRKKTPEEMEETERYFNSIKVQAPSVSSDGNESLYEKIEKRLKVYSEVNPSIKKVIVEELNISIKTLNMYIYIINDLIKELKELFKKGFLSVIDSYKYSKMDKLKQLEEYKKLLKEIDKIKKKLCIELSQKLENYEITFLQAKKYITYDYAKQLELYNRRFVKQNKKNKKAIDVEYTEITNEDKKLEKVDTEISVDIDKELKQDIQEVDTELNVDIKKELKDDTQKDLDLNINEINPIKKVKEILYGINISDEQAEIIYINSNKKLDYIEYIYYELTEQKSNITNAVGWIMEMVKPGVYNKPFVVKKGEGINPLKFNNFKGRDYDYDKLEKQLLGWDTDEEEDTEAPKDIIEGNYTSNNSKKFGNVKLSNERKEEIAEHEKLLLQHQFSNDEESNSENIISDTNDEYEKIKKGLDILGNLIEPTSFQIWIKSGIKGVNILNEKMYILCENTITVDIINDNYKNYINEIVKKLYPQIKNIEYKVQ